MANREKKIDFIISFLYVLIIITICFIFIKYLLAPLLPFITAFLIVSISRKPILAIEEKSRSRKFASMIFTVLLIAVLSSAVYGLFSWIARDLTGLYQRLSDKNAAPLFDDLIKAASTFFGKMSRYKPFSDLISVFSSYKISLEASLSEAISAALPKLLNLSLSFISFFPAAVIFLCFMFISMFYISCDYEKIYSFLMLQLPRSVESTLDETKSIITSTAKELFKSYFLLTFITFLQLLSGFLIIGIDYALLLAAIICFVDLLPILGTGTILIPWSAICFFTGNIPTGSGLIILYIFITIFRRIAEPRIVGANTGLSPLLSLVSIFLGLKLIGISGIILFPIIFITIISLNKKGFISLFKNFPQDKQEAIRKTRLKFLNFKQNDNS